MWLEVPASETAQRVAVEVSSPSGGTSEVPDVALYVGGQHKRAQSCDGAAVGSLATSAAAVEAVVPRGKTLLVQVGRGGGQMEQRVIASLLAEPIKDAPRTPRGDIAHRSPSLEVGKRSKLVLAGATVTAEDPAQPACPAPATVWRRTPITEARPLPREGPRHRRRLRDRLLRAEADRRQRDRVREPPQAQERADRRGRAQGGRCCGRAIGADKIGAGAKATAIVKRLR